jgi:hypothetical protein
VSDPLELLEESLLFDEEDEDWRDELVLVLAAGMKLLFAGMVQSVSLDDSLGVSSIIPA